MYHGGNVWDTGRPSEWLDFSASLRPEGPAPWIWSALRDAQLNLRWYPDPEMKRARKGLAGFLGVPEAYLLPTAGGIAAIDLALGLTSGCVYTQNPTFGEYAGRAEVRGRKSAVWTGSCRPGDSLVICNPNNPTGEAKTRDEMTGLIDAVHSRGGDLIVDEAFIEYCPEYSMRDRISPGLIITGSFSKILGIPGVRLGYLCASPENICCFERMALPWSPDASATEIAAHLPEHADQMRLDAETNRRRRDRFRIRLQSLGAKVRSSQSNFLLADFHREMTAAAEELKTRKILVRTCTSFGLPASFLRLAVKTEEENERLITALEEILNAR